MTDEGSSGGEAVGVANVEHVLGIAVPRGIAAGIEGRKVGLAAADVVEEDLAVAVGKRRMATATVKQPTS
jgi:hypothetical protein